MKRCRAALVLLALAMSWLVPQAASAETSEPGRFCKVGDVATTPQGAPLTCDNVDAKGNHHWVLSSGVATTTAPPETTAPPDTTPPVVTAPSVTPTTVASGMPNTGTETNRHLALGGLAVMMGSVLMYAAVDRRRRRAME